MKKQKSQKYIKKITGLLLSLSLIASSSLVVAASDPTEASKNETVYVMAALDGETKNIIVTEHIQKNQGQESVKLTTDLDSIKPLMTDLTMDKDGESLTLTTDESDIYYKGTSRKNIPVSTSITYNLDGKDISSTEAIGTSGHMIITIKQVNHEKKTIQLDGEKQEVFLPFETALVMNLDNNIFENVKISHGKMIDDGKRKVVSAILSPGFDKNFEEIESPYITDTLTIEADVVDFSIGDLYMTMVCRLPELNFSDFLGEFDDLDQQMADFSQAGQQLVDGSQELNTSMTTYFGKQTQAFDQFNTYISSDKQVLQGVLDFNNNFVDFNTGLQLYLSGTAQLFKGIGELASATPGLVEGIQSFKASLSQVLPENDQTQPLYLGLLGIQKGIEGLSDGVTQLNEGAKALSEQTPALQAGGEGLKGASAQLAYGSNQLLSNTDGLSLGLDQLQAAGNLLTTGGNDLADGMKQFKEDGIDSLADEVESSLNKIRNYEAKYDAIYQLVNEYNSFTGDNHDLDSQVTFIIKVVNP